MNEWTATATKNHTNNNNKNNKAHLFFTKSYKLIVIAAVATVAIVVVCLISVVAFIVIVVWAIIIKTKNANTTNSLRISTIVVIVYAYNKKCTHSYIPYIHMYLYIQMCINKILRKQAAMTTDDGRL